jgi:hypothetical protein
LYRADAAVVALSGVKNAGQPLIADTDVRRLARVHVVKLRDLFADSRRFGKLYQHRRRQFVLVRQQLVVRVDLAPNRVVVDYAFGAHHLLNLKQYGVVVLEDESHHRPDRQAAIFFQRDDAAAKLVARLFILRDVEDF